MAGVVSSGGGAVRRILDRCNSIVPARAVMQLLDVSGTTSAALDIAQGNPPSAQVRT
jgi:hypothetical protein